MDVDAVMMSEKFLPVFKWNTWCSGFFQLTVRTNTAGQTMVIIHFHPQNVPTDAINAEKERLMKYLQELTGSVVPTFVYWVVDDKQ